MRRIAARRGHRAWTTASVSPVVFAAAADPPARARRFAAGCGGERQRMPAGQRQPVVGKSSRRGRRRQASASRSSPPRTRRAWRGRPDRRRRRASRRPIYPARTAETRPAGGALVDARGLAAAISAAQLMSRPLRAPILFSDGDNCRTPEVPRCEALKPTGRAEGRRRAGDPDRQRRATPDGEQDDDVAGADPGLARRRRSTSCSTAAAGEPSAAVVVAPSDRAGVRDAGRRLGGEVRRSRAVERQGRAARRRPRRPSVAPAGRASTCSAPASAISDAVLKQLGKLGTARRITGADPVANAIAFARFNDGRFGWNVVDPGHGLVFANRTRPADAAAAAGAVGRRHVRAAAAADRCRRTCSPAAAGLPARHPARLRQRPRARRLQSRLDHRRRDGDLGRRAVAHRRAARDPARRHRGPKIRHGRSRAARAPRARRQVTVDDVRQLMGASTPHFALQLRNRIRTLIRGLPPTTRRGCWASRRSPGWSASASTARPAASPRSRASGRCASVSDHG